MILKTAERHKDYRSPITVWAVMDYDCLIAESPLEDVTEGDEWGWED